MTDMLFTLWERESKIEGNVISDRGVITDWKRRGVITNYK